MCFVVFSWYVLERIKFYFDVTLFVLLSSYTLFILTCIIFYLMVFAFVEKLPFSIRVILESAVRNCDNFQVRERDVQNILAWRQNQALEGGVEVAFKPARVILQVMIFLIYLYSIYSVIFVLRNFYILLWFFYLLFVVVFFYHLVFIHYM